MNNSFYFETFVTDWQIKTGHFIETYTWWDDFCYQCAPDLFLAHNDTFRGDIMFKCKFKLDYERESVTI